MSETKKSSKKELEKGWYNCTVIATGEKKAYYSSTINALTGKGILEVGNYIKDYFSPTMKR